MTHTVLFVGHRAAARDAAQRAALDVAAIVDGALPPKTGASIAHRVVDFSDLSAVEAAAKALLPLRRRGPVTVTAVVERGVVPAAILRARLRARGWNVDGISADVARNTHDKIAMKRALAAGGIPIAKHQAVDVDTDAAALIDDLGLPLVMKPRTGSGSRGLVIALDADTVRAHIAPSHIAEQFVRGIEMSVEAFVTDGCVRWSNFTTYLVPRFANLVPAPLPSLLHAVLTTLNQRAITALGITRGMTHTEFFLTDDGPVVSEIATRAPGGRIMELIGHAYGQDPWATLLDVERGEFHGFPTTASTAAATHLIHPGAGVVTGIRGVDDARRVFGVREARVRLKVGARVSKRRGLGETTGGIIVVAPTPQQAAASVLKAARLIRIDMQTDPPTSSNDDRRRQMTTDVVK